MEKKDLKPLLAPKSIAVVGVSQGRSLGGRVIDNLTKLNFAGKIYPVNPKYEEIKRMRCYPSVTAIGETVDMVMIALARPHVLKVLKEAADTGARAAVIPSSGFGETGEPGKALENDIRSIAGEANMAVCGPNCYGFVNFHGRVAAFSGPLYEPLIPGRIGLVMQSGAITHSITDPFSHRSVGLSFLISSGNETVVSGSDYIEYMIDDEHTRVIATFVEGLRDVESFIRAAEHAREKEKPIVVVKVGRSQKAQKAALAHTGSLAGPDEIFEALFRQKGVIRVRDLDELIETTIALEKIKRNVGSRVGVVTISGGASGLISDLAEENRLQLADLSPETVRNLRQILPSFGTPSNPLDCTGSAAGDLGIFKGGIEHLSRDSNVDLVAVGLNSSCGTTEYDNRLYEGMANCAKEVWQKGSDKSFVIMTYTSNTFHPKICQMFRDTDIPVLQGLQKSVLALGHATRYSEFLRNRNTGTAERVSSKAYSGKEWNAKDGVLSEYDSKKILSSCGVDCIEEILAGSRDKSIEASEKLGYPVVLKVVSPDIPHKTEAQAIRINIGSKEEVMRAYDEILENATIFKPNAEIQGILVQKMAPKGIETILGVKNDPQIGPVLMFGLGGIFVELLGDFSLRIPPIVEREALSMVMNIKAAKLFEGIRGAKKADVGAIVRNLLNLSTFAVEHRDILSEVDINPFVVFEEGRGGSALDALITVKS
ncbi:MAG: acetate--CoA ligase family protein [Deltaproteobacteria bacterium]|nr:acetate--CoA ligase family protein [Deltaproteobacteria bacterium]